MLLYHSGGNLNLEHLKSGSQKGHFLHLLRHLLIYPLRPRNIVKPIPIPGLLAAIFFTPFFPTSILGNVGLIIIFHPRFLLHLCPGLLIPIANHLFPHCVLVLFVAPMPDLVAAVLQKLSN